MDKYAILFEIADEAARQREGLRRAGLIGKDEQSLAVVEYRGGIRAAPIDVAALLLDERTLSAWARGPVQVNVVHPRCDDALPVAYDVHVRPIRDDPEFAFCPRCWRAHRGRENHDGLCDRCLRVLARGFPGRLPAAVEARYAAPA